MNFNTLYNKNIRKEKLDNFSYIQKFLGYFLVKKVKKGEILLKPGEINEQLYFVKKGIIRAFLIHSGKEFTTWFTSDDEFFFSANSFYYNVPTQEYLQAVEDCEILMVNKNIYNTVLKLNHSSAIYAIKYLNTILCEYQEQCLTLRFMSAEKKYEFLINNKKDLIPRLSQKHIASFIGIEETYLSKIIANYKDQ